MKKILITIAIIAILSVTFVFAASASEYDFIASKDFADFSNVGYDYVNIDNTQESDPEFLIIYDYTSNAIFVQPYSFKLFINWLLGDSVSYTGFINAMNYYYFHEDHICDSSSSTFVNSFLNSTGGCDEAYFNKLYYYKEITQEELDAKDEQIAGMANSIDAIDKLYQEAHSAKVELVAENATLKENNASLLSANTKLEENLEYSQNQVATLLQSRGELLAVNASLEKQLQNKINLAYAQGLVDSGSTSDVVPVLIGVITLLEGAALVIFIVSKIKKRKKLR